MGGSKRVWILIMIELTDEAISAAIKKTNDYGRDAIRLGVSSGGCAGYEYIIEFADTIAEDDHILDLSLIHISEPTRQEAISYAVFC